MSLIQKVRWSIPFSLMITVGVFAGEPGSGGVEACRPGMGGEPKGDVRAFLSATPAAGGGAAFEGAAAADITSGDTAAFKAASVDASVAKNLDGVDSLPTSFASGESSSYAAEAGAEPSASKAVESTGPVGVTKP